MLITDNNRVNVFIDEDTGEFFGKEENDPLTVTFFKHSTKDLANFAAWQIEQGFTDYPLWNNENTPRAKGLLDYISVADNFPKIKKEEFYKLANFYAYHAVINRTFTVSTEVGALILYNQKEHKLEFFIPEQQVTSGNVRWEKLLEENKKVMSLDGVETTLQDLMLEYLFVGRCHSHNTIPMHTPSPTDDYCEVGTPADPEAKSFNLLLSWFAKERTTGEIVFRATPSFGYRGYRHYCHWREVFDESIHPYVIDDFIDEKAFEVCLPQAVQEAHPFNTAILDLVTKPVFKKRSVEIPAYSLNGATPSTVGMSIEQYSMHTLLKATGRCLESGWEPNEIIRKVKKELGIEDGTV